MIRDVLNALSTFEIIVIFVGGSLVLAIATAAAIRKFVPDIGERQFEELASGLRIVYELLFALILAFVIASVLDKFNNAEGTVDAEATALAVMLRDNRAFPTEREARINAGIDAYVDALINDEWETMRHGEGSREAGAALDTMYALYEDYRPAPGVAEKFYDQALAHLDTVAASRRERLSISAASLPTILLLMLPIGAMLLVVLEYRPKLAPLSQAGFMGTLALVLSATYLLTILLDYPFSGDVSVGNAPLKTGTLAYLEDNPPRKAADGDTQLKLTPQTLAGVWASDADGTIVLRRSGGEMRGAYRFGDGTVRGEVGRDGVFRGVWCEGSRRVSRQDAGLVEWRLVRTRSGERIVTGTWSYGYGHRRDGTLTPAGGWDLHKLERDKAQDLVRRASHDPASAYCHAPGR
ncbi:MAG: hypothetical protein QOJ46_727 [bacterium]